MWKGVKHDRFHGRVNRVGQHCERPGCPEAGEIRPPRGRGSSFDGPGDHPRCRPAHLREFHAGYDWFEGMSPEEIFAAQSPVHGWERQTRAFSPTAGIDVAPRWADFKDPLEAIAARARARQPAQRSDGRVVTAEERQALDLLDLPVDASRHDLRSRYTTLARRYHPDINQGDRSMEKRLQAVVEAYQLLRKSALFA